VPEQYLRQGNLNNQLQVTIYDPIHDYVRNILEQRYIFSFALFVDLADGLLLAYLSIPRQSNVLYS